LQQDIPEQVVTDELRSYGAAIRETPELSSTLHITVSAAERQNNLIEQSHRPTRDTERQKRNFRSLERTQAFLFTHAEVGNLFRHTRARTRAWLRRRNWLYAFSLWDELSLLIP
jgi:putative transposase